MSCAEKGEVLVILNQGKVKPGSLLHPKVWKVVFLEHDFDPSYAWVKYPITRHTARVPVKWLKRIKKKEA